MAANRKHIMWEETEHLQVALRTIELMDRGYDKRSAMKEAQIQCLPLDRHRNTNNAWLGPKFAEYSDLLRSMSTAKLKAFAAEHGLTMMAVAEDQATSLANLEPTTIQAPALAPTATETPHPASEPESQAVTEPEPELVPAEAEASPTPTIEPIVPTIPINVLGVAEKNLLASVQDYMLVLLKPMIDGVVDHVHNTYVVPQLQERLSKSVEGAIQGAIQANAQRIRDHVQSQVQSVLPSIPPMDTPSAPEAKDEPAKPSEPLRLNDHWNAETDNIIVLGMWPSNQESLKLAIRNKPWFQGLRLHFVQELGELEQKRNAYTHLIQLEKFSAHLPKSFRANVKRIYPDVRGVTRAREVIEAIVLGNRTVASY